MTPETSSRVRIVALAALALALLGLNLVHGVAPYLAKEAPRTALMLDPGQPDALIKLADELVNPSRARSAAEPGAGSDNAAGQSAKDRLGGWAEIALRAATAGAGGSTPTQTSAQPPVISPESRARARAYARRALANDPLNARALRILGQLAELEGDRAEARSFMQAASKSFSENAAVYWMMSDSFLNGDRAKALYYADILMRKRPETVEIATRLVARVAEEGDASDQEKIHKYLAANPLWRLAFFANLNNSITDAQTPLRLMQGLKETSAPPTPQELETYLNFLIGRRFYDLAYYTWLQFLPRSELAQVGLLNNGSFTNAPSGMPFDWRIDVGSGVTADIATPPGEDSGRALYLEFGPGRVEFPGVSQILMLPPGSYQLTGKYRGEIDGLRGVQWHVTCLGQSTPLADGPMFTGSAPTWTQLDFAFTVPDSDCRAQMLRVNIAARSESEKLVAGNIWFDDMSIGRAKASVAEPDSTVPAP